ncbi:MAG: ATP-binding protein [bacterium]|nr:ATP-binding protein [bacterium]MCM1373856.1 ATP-binding protein [Muribaculum sp.]
MRQGNGEPGNEEYQGKRDIILVTGIPAAGKSVLAERLSAELGLPWFSKDRIKEKLFDTIGFTSREEKVKLGIAATSILYDLAEQMMRCHKPFILENNFEASCRQELAELLTRYGYRTLTLRLTGDYALIYERFALRDKSGERHPGHVTNSRYSPDSGAAPGPTVTLEQYIAGIQSREMDSFSIGGRVITVDTTDFSQVDYAAVCRQVRDWHYILSP